MGELDTVRAYAQAWRKWSHEDDFPFDASHCINGTRVAISALSVLGVRAKPVSVRFILFNRPAWELYERDVPVTEWPEHAWSMGVGPGSDTGQGRWNGHLVCEGADWTLDVSAGQFHRPGRMTMTGPRLIPTRLPEQGYSATFHDDHRQVLLIGRWPENNHWRTAAGWSRLHAVEVAEAVKRTRRLLDHPAGSDRAES